MTDDTEQHIEPTLSQLRWMEGWFKFMSKPGPKASINGVLQEYPESSRLEMEKELAKIQSIIAKRS